MFRVHTSTGTDLIAAVHAREADGLHGIATIRVRDASGLGIVLSPSGGSLAVTPTPANTFGARSSLGPVTVTTEQVSVSAIGGTAPYTYAWAFVSSDGGTWTISAPTADTTQFNCSGVSASDTFLATFICTVTDAHGATGTASVTASVFNYGGF